MNQAVNVLFEFSQSFADVLDGAVIPEVTLYGTGTSAEDTIDYHQQIAAVSPFVLVDSVVPTAAVDPLPALQAYPQITLSWSGVDDASGVLDFDVQVQVDGEEWVDWLVAPTPDGRCVFSALRPSLHLPGQGAG